ncbi:Acetate kinase [Seminavis robusta]|uniref:Probable acetate kinase n=1 Tax=Seminavis robusta TaxID=568900 RepID=A0A9N8H772_9STRA|nr:Acetate kinase [Seminavis robusta]|eukprot:Sro133_g062870.1 Acetate kinase (414) ;mRNA; f:12403-13842
MAKQQYILALNAGSSSLKASLLQSHNNGTITEVAHFLGERLNTPGGVIHLPQQTEIAEQNMSHEQALSHVIDYLRKEQLLENLVAIGHRVVHGGTTFTSSVVVEQKELQQIKDVSHLAPLHNPHNVAGIETMQKLLQDQPQPIPNVAVFDTSFHSAIPPVAYQYPLPQEYRDQQMRKFGFHGTSVHYVTLQADQRLSQLKHTNCDAESAEDGFHLIVCHLGNGASVTAVSHGKSMDTSMGFTPLSGLMMGTRSGSIDPSIVQFACSKLDKTVDQVTHDMNKRSGLTAYGEDSDMRSLLAKRAAGDESATLAVDMFVYRLTQHIASSMIALKGPLDAIVFTAGIGEHSAEIRQLACDQLHQSLLPQLALDATRNAKNGKASDGVVSQEGAWPVILTIPTDEEAMIAKECLRLVQ